MQLCICKEVTSRIAGKDYDRFTHLTLGHSTNKLNCSIPSNRGMVKWVPGCWVIIVQWRDVCGRLTNWTSAHLSLAQRRSRLVLATARRRTAVIRTSSACHSHHHGHHQVVAITLCSSSSNNSVAPAVGSSRRRRPSSTISGKTRRLTPVTGRLFSLRRRRRRTALASATWARRAGSSPSAVTTVRLRHRRPLPRPAPANIAVLHGHRRTTRYGATQPLITR